MIEAMACGTPVIAYPRGSVPEIIEDGRTGFIVRSVEEAVDAALRIPQLSRKRCREVFEQRFTAARMAGAYVDVYDRLCAYAAPPTRQLRLREWQCVAAAATTADRVSHPTRGRLAADDRIRVLKHDDTFAVFNRFGDITPSYGELGIYHQDTRFLSKLVLRLEKERPLLLSSTIKDDNAILAVDLMNPDVWHDGAVVIPHGTVHISRSMHPVAGDLSRARPRAQLRAVGRGHLAVDRARRRFRGHLRGAGSEARAARASAADARDAGLPAVRLRGARWPGAPYAHRGRPAADSAFRERHPLSNPARAARRAGLPACDRLRVAGDPGTIAPCHRRKRRAQGRMV